MAKTCYTTGKSPKLSLWSILPRYQNQKKGHNLHCPIRAQWNKIKSCIQGSDWWLHINMEVSLTLCSKLSHVHDLKRKLRLWRGRSVVEHCCSKDPPAGDFFRNDPPVVVFLALSMVITVWTFTKFRWPFRYFRH